MRDIEAIWNALEAWREETSGEVAIEAFGAGWLCRLQAPRRGIPPALCHGVDATTAVEGALAVVLQAQRQRDVFEATSLASSSGFAGLAVSERCAPERPETCALERFEEKVAPPADSHVTPRAWVRQATVPTAAGWDTDPRR